MKKEKMKKKTNNKNKKSWHVSPQDLQKSRQLSEKLGIPRAVAQVLINRGIDNEEEGRKFLRPEISQLHSPFLLKGMLEAVELIWKKIYGGEKITVFGDYDVDGITATALLLLLFNEIGVEASYHIPNRVDEGYGLNTAAVEKIKKNGSSLLITVDCGINACEEVSLAREIGMEVVVTDHHQPGQALPDASAVVNPLQPGCRYPFKELSGVGLVYKLSEALLAREGFEENGAIIEGLLDLVALGTVADVVPLLGENRVLTATGLEKMNGCLRTGLKELCKEAGIKQDRLTARDLAFGLAPRLNAAGRLGDADSSLQLLMTDDPHKASELANFLDRENNRRQEMESKVLAEACQVAGEKMDSKTRLNTLVLASENWHQGVLGIAASRMVDIYGMPVILVSLEDDLGKGSGRSAGGFNLIGALEKCEHLLLEYGGHSAAAGLTIEKSQIEDFWEEIDLLAGSYFGAEGPSQPLRLDTCLHPEEINLDLARSLERLSPFGHGNPRPLFYGQSWYLKDKKEVGKDGNHLRLTLEKDGHLLQGIGFDAPSRLPGISVCRSLSPVFTVSLDRWQGRERPQLELNHFKFTDEFQYKGLLSIVDRRGFKNKETYIAETIKEKEDKALVYVNTTAAAQRLKEYFKGFPGLVISHQGRISPPGGQGAGVGDIILYDVPWQEERLLDLLGMITGDSRTGKREDGLKMHLIFGEKDYYNNIRMMISMLPSLCSVAHIYFTAREMFEEKKVSVEQATGVLKEHLPFPSTTHLIKKALLILEELTLVVLSENELCVNGAAVNEYDVLLEHVSAAEGFLEERQKWNDLVRWQEFMVFTEGREVTSSLLQKCKRFLK